MSNKRGLETDREEVENSSVKKLKTDKRNEESSDTDNKLNTERNERPNDKELMKAFPSQTDTDKYEQELLTAITFSIGKNKTASYKYVDNDDKLDTTIDDLQKAIKDGKTIAVDCEGVNLSRFGSVTMVNIAFRNQVYLIDVLKIGKKVFDRGLRSILEDKLITKLMFDCREDADALLHIHYVKLNGVLDIQVLEVMKRGKGRRYTKIRSLKHCLELHGRDKILLEIKIQGREHMAESKNIWEKRPLADSMLKYASIDVIALFELYDVLGSTVNKDRWRSSSEQNCNYQRSRERTYRDGDGFLPSGII